MANEVDVADNDQYEFDADDSFSIEERLDLLRASLPSCERMTIAHFDNRYLVDYAKEQDAAYILRDYVIDNPASIGKTIVLPIAVSDPFDQLNKRVIPAYVEALSRKELSWFQSLQQRNVIRVEGDKTLVDIDVYIDPNKVDPADIVASLGHDPATTTIEDLTFDEALRQANAELAEARAGVTSARQASVATAAASEAAEAGAAGRATKGLYRVHQFTKVEMFAFSAPEQSDDLHEEMRDFECQIFDALEVPYRVIDTASGDLGGPAYRKFDLEAWMPGRGESGEYGEVTSTSNCTDYQARRLNARYKTKGEIYIGGMRHACDGYRCRAVLLLLERRAR